MIQMRDRKIDSTEHKVKKGITFGPFLQNGQTVDPWPHEEPLSVHVTFHTSEGEGMRGEGGGQGTGTHLRMYFDIR
jgi:hypothetical protein